MQGEFCILGLERTWASVCICLEIVRLDGQAGIKVSVEHISLQRDFKWTGSNGVHFSNPCFHFVIEMEDYSKDRQALL
jgi:hypothetical protein